MNGTHGKSTFEDGPGQQLLRRAAHGKLARWGASWEQNANVGNVPTIISAQDSDLVGNRIFQTSFLENKGSNTIRRDYVARFSGNVL